MKERPILFSGAMVRAILDGRKTQTRRVVKPQPEYWEQTGGYHYPLDKKPYRGAPVGRVRAIDEFRCPYGQPGDRLWVRETWNIQTIDGVERVAYRADIPNGYSSIKWRPSIFMPRALSRVTLEIVSIQVERMQDITPEDAMHEGITAPMLNDKYSTMRGGFSVLWDDINAKRGYGWDVNPWVWAITFKRIV